VFKIHLDFICWEDLQEDWLPSGGKL